jgi:hypothetical protein
MDRKNGITLVELSREKILEFYLLDLFANGFELFLELLEKDVAALFFKDPDRLFDVGQLVFDRLERRYRAFETGLFLEEFF